MQGLGCGLRGWTTRGTCPALPKALQLLPATPQGVAGKVPGQAQAIRRHLPCHTQCYDRNRLSGLPFVPSRPGASLCHTRHLPQGCHDQATTTFQGLHRGHVTFISPKAGDGDVRAQPWPESPRRRGPQDSPTTPGPLFVVRPLPGTLASVSHSGMPPLCANPFNSFCAPQRKVRLTPALKDEKTHGRFEGILLYGARPLTLSLSPPSPLLVHSCSRQGRDKVKLKHRNVATVRQRDRPNRKDTRPQISPLLPKPAPADNSEHSLVTTDWQRFAVHAATPPGATATRAVGDSVPVLQKGQLRLRREPTQPSSMSSGHQRPPHLETLLVCWGPGCIQFAKLRPFSVYLYVDKKFLTFFFY